MKMKLQHEFDYDMEVLQRHLDEFLDYAELHINYYADNPRKYMNRMEARVDEVREHLESIPYIYNV